MSRDSILPPHPTDFWIKRWLFGIALPGALVCYGVYSLITEHSYAIARAFNRIEFVEVSGFQATLMGIAYIGAALALFSYCYAPYSERFCGVSDYGLAAGLLGTMIGVGWCSWIFLAG